MKNSSEKTEEEYPWSVKRKIIYLEFYTRKKYLSQNKSFLFEKYKVGRFITSRITENITGSLLDRRKMILGRNMDLHKGTKNIRNGNYMGKYKKEFWIVSCLFPPTGNRFKRLEHKTITIDLYSRPHNSVI